MQNIYIMSMGKYYYFVYLMYLALFVWSFGDIDITNVMLICIINIIKYFVLILYRRKT